MNSTIMKFGYPDSLIGESGNWKVMLRPRQVTMGSMILACTEEVSSISKLSSESAQQIPIAIGKIERMLEETLGPQKINYLALMMMDPHVHFHVIPRYETPKEIFGLVSEDHGWPMGPQLGKVTDLADDQEAQLLSLLRSSWENQ